MLIITALIVGGSSFIHWQFNTAMFWSLYQWAGLVPLALVPFVTFLARIDDFLARVTNGAIAGSPHSAQDLTEE